MDWMVGRKGLAEWQWRTQQRRRLRRRLRRHQCWQWQGDEQQYANNPIIRSSSTDDNVVIVVVVAIIVGTSSSWHGHGCLLVMLLGAGLKINRKIINRVSIYFCIIRVMDRRLTVRRWAPRFGSISRFRADCSPMGSARSQMVIAIWIRIEIISGCIVVG